MGDAISFEMPLLAPDHPRVHVDPNFFEAVLATSGLMVLLIYRIGTIIIIKIVCLPDLNNLELSQTLSSIKFYNL